MKEFIFDPQILILSLILSVLNFVLSYFMARFVYRLAHKTDITDNPMLASHRKKQREPIALLGGQSFIWTSLFIGGILWLFRKQLFLYVNFDSAQIAQLLGQNLEPFRLIYIYLAIMVLAIAGVLDDKFQFSSKIMFIPITIALILTIFNGAIKVEVFSYPFNDLIPNIAWFHSFLAFVWIGFCIAATKFLDGHDGLVSSIGVISLVTIALTASLNYINQPFIFALALIWSGGILGFLPFNLPNAKMYLGESGSLVIGYIIGVLSLLSGTKVATAGSLLAFFVFDVVVVMALRVRRGQSPFEGDRTHLHLRLTDIGWSKWRVLGFYIILSSISGVIGVFFSTQFKIYYIILQFLLILLFLFLVPISQKSPHPKN
jgi:UDP-GlcNAc:undecaprenyl-phosphate/decaprenyl-phosphate GlcNAc-1-phosphate transferase